ncbi:MAG: ABC transporter ATP-binding protein [Bacteroidales bacterium]
MTVRPILEVRDLSVSFRSDNERVSAVKDVSFSLASRHTLGIVGESGSGKSVTALSLMRLIPSPPGSIDSGKILFSDGDGKNTDLLGLDETSLSGYRGNHISMIFQEPMTSLNPVYTCGNQVVEAIRKHRPLSKREARDYALHLFEEVRLPRPPDILGAYPHQLSGGQKQRVMIAMAISCNPAILIADEPTTALDVTVQKNILELIKSLQDRYRMSVIFISHDLGVVSEVADEVIVMNGGRIVESGTAERIFLHPEHPYTQGLLACRPSPGKLYNRLPTVRDFMENKADRGRIKIKGEGIKIKKKREGKQEGHKAPLLRVRNLSTHFSHGKGLFGHKKRITRAVDDVSLEIYPGETLGLVGESGCGKTTLGRSVLRLIDPSSGVVDYNGTNITELGSRQLRKFRKKMQIVFQDPYSSLNPRLPVGYAVLEPIRVHGLYTTSGERKEAARQLFYDVGLDPEYYHRYPHELSGGQRQRICIARALAVRPEFIICDESVSALDVSVQAQILNLLNDLKAHFGLTYIFISHDLSVVNYMSDRIAVMQEGKIIETGYADDVYENPSTAYTRRLIDAVPGKKFEKNKEN